MTDIDILEVLKKVQGDREAKRVFFAMPREEQLMSIMGIQAYIANELANTQKGLDDLRTDFNSANDDSLAYRRHREAIDGNGNYHPDETITQKIVGAAKRRFDQIVIIAGIIYLIWEKKP